MKSLFHLFHRGGENKYQIFPLLGDSFDYDRSAMHKNVKKQFDLQGLVKDQELI